MTTSPKFIVRICKHLETLPLAYKRHYQCHKESKVLRMMHGTGLLLHCITWSFVVVILPVQLTYPVTVFYFLFFIHSVHAVLKRFRREIDFWWFPPPKILPDSSVPSHSNFYNRGLNSFVTQYLFYPRVTFSYSTHSELRLTVDKFSFGK